MQLLRCCFGIAPGEPHPATRDNPVIKPQWSMSRVPPVAPAGPSADHLEDLQRPLDGHGTRGSLGSAHPEPGSGFGGLWKKPGSGNGYVLPPGLKADCSRPSGLPLEKPLPFAVPTVAAASNVASKGGGASQRHPMQQQQRFWSDAPDCGGDAEDGLPTRRVLSSSGSLVRRHRSLVTRSSFSRTNRVSPMPSMTGGGASGAGGPAPDGTGREVDSGDGKRVPVPLDTMFRPTRSFLRQRQAGDPLAVALLVVRSGAEPSQGGAPAVRPAPHVIQHTPAGLSGGRLWQSFSTAGEAIRRQRELYRKELWRGGAAVGGSALAGNAGAGKGGSCPSLRRRATDYDRVPRQVSRVLSRVSSTEAAADEAALKAEQDELVEGQAELPLPRRYVSFSKVHLFGPQSAVHARRGGDEEDPDESGAGNGAGAGVSTGFGGGPRRGLPPRTSAIRKAIEVDGEDNRVYGWCDDVEDEEGGRTPDDADLQSTDGGNRTGGGAGPGGDGTGGASSAGAAWAEQRSLPGSPAAPQPPGGLAGAAGSGGVGRPQARARRLFNSASGHDTVGVAMFVVGSGGSGGRAGGSDTGDLGTGAGGQEVDTIQRWQQSRTMKPRRSILKRESASQEDVPPQALCSSRLSVTSQGYSGTQRRVEPPATNGAACTAPATAVVTITAAAPAGPQGVDAAGPPSPPLTPELDGSPGWGGEQGRCCSPGGEDPGLHEGHLSAGEAVPGVWAPEAGGGMVAAQPGASPSQAAGGAAPHGSSLDGDQAAPGLLPGPGALAAGDDASAGGAAAVSALGARLLKNVSFHPDVAAAATPP